MTRSRVPGRRTADLAAELAGFTGTQGYACLSYPWLRARLLLTDGALYLAREAGAFWLMDAIASHQCSPRLSAVPFQFWTLTVHAAQAADLVCTDGSEVVLARQSIPLTTFPLEAVTLYVVLDEYLGGWVVMLPGEY